LQHPLHRRGVRAAEPSTKSEQWHLIPEPVKCLASSRRFPCFDMLKFRYEVTLRGRMTWTGCGLAAPTAPAAEHHPER